MKKFKQRMLIFNVLTITALQSMTLQAFNLEEDIPVLGTIKNGFINVLAYGGLIWFIAEIALFWVGLGNQNVDSTQRYHQIIRLISAAGMMSTGFIVKILGG